MTFIIINTTNKTAIKLLREWYKPRENRRKSAQKYFIRQFGPGTYLLEGNGAVLALLYDLKSKRNGDVYIYVAKPLVVRPEFPEEVVEVVESCQKEGRDLLKSDLKPLEKIEIDCSVSWKRNSSQ
jgi:hypothetical protein